MGMSYTTGDFHTNGTSGLGSLQSSIDAKKNALIDKQVADLNAAKKQMLIDLQNLSKVPAGYKRMPQASLISSENARRLQAMIKNIDTQIEKLNKSRSLVKTTMNGVGAMMTQGDFGAMGTMGFSVFGVDVGAAVTKLYQQQVSNLQQQATTAVNKAVTTFVNQVTGQKVTLTPQQQAAYEQTGVLPAQIQAQPTFMDQYGKYIMIGGGILASLIAISLIVKMTKK